MFSAWWWYRDASANVMVHKPAAREIVLLQAYPEELLVASICLACVPGFVEYGMPPENTVFSIAHRADQSRSLDPFDCREPGRCAVIVVSRLNPVRFDGGDIPSIAGVERRSQLFLTDGVRASIGTIVTEAQHIQGSIVLGHRR